MGVNIARWALLLALATAGPASAETWESLSGKMDGMMKRMDKRQSFVATDACNASYEHVSPNRKQVSGVKVDLKMVDGKTVQNDANHYLTDFDYTSVGFTCKLGQKPNCVTGSYAFGSMPVKAGDEPAFCKLFISMVAQCQGVDGFPASKRGCELLDWEKDYVKNGPEKKPARRMCGFAPC